MTSAADYARLAREGFRYVPRIRDLPRGQHEPCELYAQLAQGPNSGCLESVGGGERWGHHSIVLLPARDTLVVDKGELHRYRDGELAERWEGDPWQLLRRWMSCHKAPALPDLPPFCGGLAGYFAYDMLRYVEPRLAVTAPAAHPLGTPDALLIVARELVVFDRRRDRLRLVVHADTEESGAWDRAGRRLDELEQQLTVARPALAPLDAAVATDAAIEDEARCGTGREVYEAGIERIREYIIAGDIMQAVPSRRLSLPLGASVLDFYRALRQLNPSPYLYFFDFGDFHIVGSSPESLARCRGGTVLTRPIAGTRRRGRDAAEDRALELELLADPKEVAEHLMLVDLGRNDVGRIARPGRVAVSEYMVVERYSHVMHIVSTVIGQLREDSDALDVLSAILPAGTLSGAPKIRAMQIIDELEPVRRGMYGGAVGYLSWQGDMDTAVAIRTAVVKDGTVFAQAGGGIVADSVPALEWEETASKARVMLRAVAMARSAAS